jgi:integrase/recombinase XerC
MKYLKHEKRYSPHTLRAYYNDLDQFFNHLELVANTRNVSELENVEKVVRDWIVCLMEEKISERTINRKISTLRTYFRYLRKMNKLEKDPLTKIFSLKTAERIPFFIDEAQMNLLDRRELYSDDFLGMRDRLVIEMLYQTGIRVSELTNISEKNIDWTNKQLLVHGKRDKERIIPINDQLIGFIKKYLNSRRKHFRGMGEQSLLLVTNKGNTLYTKAVYRIVRKYLSMVTTIKQKSPHVLRHSFATHMLNDGADLNAIKELLGHSNLSATQIYTHSTFEKLKKVYKQAHPRT